MTPDPIISEIWRIREEYSRQFDGDLRALMDDVRRRHAESGPKSATRPPMLRRKRNGLTKAPSPVPNSVPEDSRMGD